jgi:thioredoxin-like negative regulator of GroEL
MIFLTQEKDIIITGLQSLYFYSSWMPHHKKMMSMLSKMEEKYKDMGFFAVDVDFFKVFCKRFNVTSIPTIIILNNGKELRRINGLILTSALRKAFADICDSIGDING